MLTVIDEESDRLNHLIEQAVEMEQLDANKVQLDLRPQPVRTLVQAGVEHERERVPKREFRIAIGANVSAVLVDGAWIQKVL